MQDQTRPGQTLVAAANFYLLKEKEKVDPYA